MRQFLSVAYNLKMQLDVIVNQWRKIMECVPKLMSCIKEYLASNDDMRMILLTASTTCMMTVLTISVREVFAMLEYKG